MDFTFVGLMFVCVVGVLLNTALAKRKGYPVLVGILVGLLLPLWGIILIALIPNRAKRESGASSLSITEVAPITAGSAALGVVLTGALVVLFYLAMWGTHLLRY